MPLSISPTIAFRPSVFYDVNHNPLNIPCEGPKVVPMFLEIGTSDDGIFIIDFTQLFTSGQLSALQSMVFDPTSLGSPGMAYFEFAGTGQKMNFPFNVGSTNDIIPSTQSVPISCVTPPKMKVDISEFTSGGLGLQLYNYQHPVFLTNSRVPGFA